jgi:protein-disulfide isomerase
MKTRVVFLLAMVLALGGLSSGTAAAEQGKQKMPATSTSRRSEVSTITVNGISDIDPAKAFGSKTPVLVVEIYSDFQCPVCRQLFTQTLNRVMENYVTGATPCKIYIVHRDFLISYHAYSRAAAEYARAAAHIGRCQEVESALFQNQERWEATGDVKGTVASALSPAEMKRVQALVDSKALEPLMERDQQLGLALPVRATPTMVFHTRDGKAYPVTGMVSYEVLKNFMDRLLL